MPELLHVLFGYLSGSVLYSELFVYLKTKQSLMEISSNGNPGASNAFKYAGPAVGIISAICDLLKGLIPVYLFILKYTTQSPFLILMMIAPLLGHNHSILFKFKGGIGIAVCFGILLALLPDYIPAISLAVLYILSLIVSKKDNSIKSIYCFILLDIIVIYEYIVKLTTVNILTGVIIISVIIIKNMIADYRVKTCSVGQKSY